ncbi:MAG: ArsR family transcriptional regulator [Castellaniella sp.]|uniref:ArsR/SmtB family transcription factor n=1 Tax=Castellaniella sp. TaxID=1955812 RepID=UPI00121E661A|nr:metalloregulator ArsR/SmtB family transcription factor [Castellaniella sp.]TAN26034.1 MAG: ArsR family transcriptional regulator [Castellaniella sp.]
METLEKILDLDTSGLDAHAEEAAALLRALANPRRLRILCLLTEGERNVGAIHAHFPAISQSALSQHLAKLRQDGLVVARREAQTMWYSLCAGPAEQMVATLHRIYCSS